MKEMTSKDRECAEAYDRADPKQFGNLHERMKYLIEKLKELPEGPGKLAVRTAADDLATEVKHHVPATPPFGKRVGYKSPNIR